MIWWLVLADTVMAIYLVNYGLRRERRDKAGVLIVGGVLAVCAMALIIIGWPASPPNEPLPAPSEPAGLVTAV